MAAKTKTELVTKIGELERLRDSAQVAAGAKSPTVEQWLFVFLASKTEVTPATYSRIEWAIRAWLIPNFGSIQLAKLTPEMIEDGIRRLSYSDGRPASQTTKYEAFQVLRAALTLAWRRERITKNPAATVTVRTPKKAEIDPLTPDEVQALLSACVTRHSAARWVTSLALGLRQGEALGLKWTDIDFTTGVIKIRRQWLRRSYSHGCATVQACAEYSAKCPNRITNSRIGNLKTSAGRRDLVAPSQLLELLREHRKAQAAARLRAGDCWHDEGWVFATADGRALDHRADGRSFKSLIQAAKIRPARVHDLRHTNATILLVEGVDSRVVQELMGWSPSAAAAMTARYQHVVESLRRDAAEKVSRNLFGGLSEPEAEEKPKRKTRRTRP